VNADAVERRWEQGHTLLGPGPGHGRPGVRERRRGCLPRRRGGRSEGSFRVPGTRGLFFKVRRLGLDGLHRRLDRDDYLNRQLRGDAGLTHARLGAAGPGQPDQLRGRRSRSAICGSRRLALPAGFGQARAGTAAGADDGGRLLPLAGRRADPPPPGGGSVRRLVAL